MKKRGKKKRRQRGDSTPASNGSFNHRPFKGLTLEPIAEDKEPAAPPEPEPEAPAILDEADEYLQAMADVEPLTGGRVLAAKEPRPKPMLAEEDDDVLVMRQLDDLVHGETPFDFADTDEYIEAHVTGIDRRLVRKLKRGEFSYQAHLDLHGLNREQARDAVAEFIRAAQHDSKRCVLIIHGRGSRSKDNIPVLKNKLAAWLTRGAIGRRVLAYASAKSYDGGTGAVYVLLRG